MLTFNQPQVKAFYLEDSALTSAAWRLLSRVLLLFCLLTCSPAWAQTPPGPVDGILLLMRARLQLAEPVARVKWNTHKPVQDRVREHQVLLKVAAGAERYGVKPGEASDFFKAQIEASKLTQWALLAGWKARKLGPFADTVDLGKDIRPKLDGLTPKILTALHDVKGVLGQAGGREILRARARVVFGKEPNRAVEAALRPLFQLCRPLRKVSVVTSRADHDVESRRQGWSYLLSNAE